MNRFRDLAARLAAGLTLLAILIAPPVIVVRLIGRPVPAWSRLTDEATGGQLSTDTTMRVAALIGLVLWVFAVVTIANEARHVLSAQRPVATSADAAPVAALAAARRGVLARLVRVALVGTVSTAATVSSFASVAYSTISTGLAVDLASPPAAAVVAGTSGGPAAGATAPGGDASAALPGTGGAIEATSSTGGRTVVSNGRDTPLSVAIDLGDESLRDRIIEMNTGGDWAGGVFPAGMEVRVPQVAPPVARAVPVIEQGVVATSYTVRPGDGMWTVAEHLLGDGSRHRELHDLVVGQEVAPGITYTDATTTIHPGWVFTLTHPATAVTGHLVVRGDTLGSIAERHLGDAARWPEIWELNEGRDMGGGRTFDDPNLILPGWQLELPTSAPVVAAPVAAPVAAAPEAAAPDTGAPDTAGDVDPAGSARPENVWIPKAVPTAGSSAGGLAPPVPTGVAGASDAPTAAAPAAAGSSAVAASSATSNEAADDHDRLTATSVAALAGGGLALAGVVALLDRLRRRRRAHRPVGRTIAPLSTQLRASEQIIRTAARFDLATRVDFAIRSLGPELADRDVPVRCRYVLADDDSVTVVLDREVEPPLGWAPGAEPHSWTCTLSDAELLVHGIDWTPWPAMMPLGLTDDGRQVLVDLEALGSVAVTGRPGPVRAVVAAAVAALATSPYADMVTVLDDDLRTLHRLDDALANRHRVTSTERLVARLEAWVAPFSDDGRGRHLIASRAACSPDYQPCVAAVTCALDDDQRARLGAFRYGTDPVALITTDVGLAAIELAIDDDHRTTFEGLVVRCHHLTPIAVEAVADLAGAVDAPALSDLTPSERYDDLEPVVGDARTRLVVGEPDAARLDLEADEPEPADRSEARAGAVDDDDHTIVHDGDVSVVDEHDQHDVWELRLLGEVTLEHPDGHAVPRSRDRELLAVLALHPDGLTGAQLELMLFPDQLGTATVKPRISDLRKALGGGDASGGRRFLPPAIRQRYRVHHVVVDADRLFGLLDLAADTDDVQERINALAGALRLVTGPIGVGEATSWGWATEHLAAIEAGVVDAGLELAELASAQHNWTLADWAATRTQLANPYEQRGLPYAIRARHELGDRAAIQRLHDTTVELVDELDPAVASAFYEALRKRA